MQKSDIQDVIYCQMATIGLINQLINIAEESQRNSLLTALKVDKLLENLKLIKLDVESLRFSIAFVGTMSSGKSTTINALVGTEVLPHRHTAMTSVPTRVTHSIGQEFPVLVLNEKIKGVLEKALLVVQKVLLELKQEEFFKTSNPDLDELIKKICNGEVDTSLKSRYEDQKEISEVLILINDLVRLCNKLNGTLDTKEILIEFPTKLEEYPEILVEFSYLKQLDQNYRVGQITLIDSPGYNEAEQDIFLKPVVDSVLSNSSSVAYLLDYTLMGGSDEEKMREETTTIHDKYGKKLYVLVNKFDQHVTGQEETEIDEDYEDKVYEKTKSYVRDALFAKKIPLERIFPISAKFAFFANKAFRHVQVNNCLPRTSEAAWVRDFAKLVLGTGWQKGFEKLRVDAVTTKEKIDVLLEESKLGAASQVVVTASLKNSIPECLQLAISQINLNYKAIFQELKLRLKGLDEDEKKVKKHIEELEKRITRINDCKRVSMEKRSNIQKFLNDKIDETLKKQIQLISEFLPALQGSFKSLPDAPEKMEFLMRWQAMIRGVTYEEVKKQFGERQQKYMDAISEECKKLSEKFEVEFDLSILTSQDVKRILLENDILDYTDKDQCNKFLEEVSSKLKKVIESMSFGAIDKINNQANVVREQLVDFVNSSILPIIEQEKSALNSEFSLEIEIPLFELKKIDINSSNLIKNVYSTEKRRWYHVITFWKEEFNWKKDEYHYRIQPIYIRDNIDKESKIFIKELDKVTKISLENDFKEKLEIYFLSVKKEFEKILSILNKTLDDQKKSKDEQSKLRRLLEVVVKLSNNLSHDLQATCEATNERIGTQIKL